MTTLSPPVCLPGLVTEGVRYGVHGRGVLRCKGNAIYLATESKASAIGPVLNSIYKMVSLQPGPRTPDGVYARVVDGRTLYLNTTERQQSIPIEGRRKGIVSSREYDGTLILAPWDADLIP